MELINDIEIEVTQISIRLQKIVDKRRIFYFKRLILMDDVESISEEAYLVENNYASCGCIILKSGEWLKTKEPYEELKKIYSEWMIKEKERILKAIKEEMDKEE